MKPHTEKYYVMKGTERIGPLEGLQRYEGVPQYAQKTGRNDWVPIGRVDTVTFDAPCALEGEYEFVTNGGRRFRAAAAMTADASKIEVAISEDDDWENSPTFRIRPR